MTAKWSRVKRYSDGLIHPDWRIVGVHKGVEWVTDRYVMVRTDMFERQVTARLPKEYVSISAEGLRDSAYRAVLGGIPRDAKRARLGFTIKHWDGPTSLVVIQGHNAVAVNNDVRALLEACDRLALDKGRVVGFQHRPRSSRPVLVCVVMSVRWESFGNLHYAEEAAS